jgi:hypothetical protein
MPANTIDGSVPEPSREAEQVHRTATDDAHPHRPPRSSWWRRVLSDFRQGWRDPRVLAAVPQLRDYPIRRTA